MISVSYGQNVLKVFILLGLMCKVFSTVPAPLPTTIDHGLGGHINWTTLDKGIEDSVKTRKPIMMIIHQTWCKACRDLLPRFRASESISEMAQYFEMVNVIDEEIPEDDAFAPDGGYFPRILFIGPDGDVRTDIQNPRATKKFLFYHYDTDTIELAMMKALRTFYQFSDDDDDVEL
uniref:thioredoxin domain-containing protein 12-like n=1 Tax=Ciona intestinalis TaxID=7719 RepID=UPI000180CDB2|nr:thioredoxin domain-containing protein 12-like [Ciona intestinalis]|eukprot:XP_002119504.1 thioredoxin domain-containing protein 12-like [Ciona intestinalis]